MQLFVRFFLIPICFIAVAVVIARSPSGNKYGFADWELFAFATAVYIAALMGGKIRSIATVIASLAFGLSCTELVSASMESDPPRVTLVGFYARHPILGWGHAGPGTYHARKVDPDGRVIFDVDYTIDAPGLRRTLSAPSGRTIAFFGDSFTFGDGVRDEDTLPQAFADIDQRRLRVLNFGVSAYGPNQFLRAIETGLYDHLLADAKVFVFQTNPWQAERSSCLVDFVIGAPRYELRAGEPVYAGLCTATAAPSRLREFLGRSATFRRLIQPVSRFIGPRDIGLYIAEIRRAAQLAKAKYGVPTIVIFLPAGDAYLAKAGMKDAEIEARLRESGLLVLEGSLSQADFEPGTVLKIAGDGHPTAAAHRARARMLHDFLTKNLSDLITSSVSN
ncbi:MAG: SGNH/GDSL hydrolase family protein [Beijerinckiaceae bacterium]